MFPPSGTEQGEHSKLSCGDSEESLGHGNKQSAGSKTQNFRAGGESKAGKHKKQLNHMAAPSFCTPSPSPGNPSPSLQLCSPNRTESPWDTKIYSTPGWWEQVCFWLKPLPSKPTSGNGVAFCAASLHLKTLNYQKSKVTEVFAGALFPLQWLLFKVPLSWEKV